MRYAGTTIFTDGAKHSRGAACFAAVILCDNRFLFEIKNAFKDTSLTAGQMEVEAICRAVAWVADHMEKVRPPYRLFTDYEPIVNLYNGPNWSRYDGSVGRMMQKGKEIGVEMSHISAHKQEHNGNKICDITCRALCGLILQHGANALSLVTLGNNVSRNAASSNEERKTCENI